MECPNALEFLMTDLSPEEREAVTHAFYELLAGGKATYPTAMGVLLTACARGAGGNSGPYRDPLGVPLAESMSVSLHSNVTGYKKTIAVRFNNADPVKEPPYRTYAKRILCFLVILMNLKLCIL